MGQPLADQHHRPLGLPQHPAGLVYGDGVGGRAKVALGRGNDLNLRLVVQGIGGEGDVYRACGRGLGLVEGAAKDRGHLLRVSDLGAPLGELPRHLDEVRTPLGQLAHVVVA